MKKIKQAVQKWIGLKLGLTVAQKNIGVINYLDDEKGVYLVDFIVLGGEHVVYRLEINRNNREKARLKIAVRYADEKIVI